MLTMTIQQHCDLFDTQMQGIMERLKQAASTPGATNDELAAIAARFSAIEPVAKQFPKTTPTPQPPTT